MSNTSGKQRKTPFGTRFAFSKQRLKQALHDLKRYGLKQVEVVDTNSPGLHAVIYLSGRITFFADYQFRKRSRRKRLGSLDTLSVDDARAKNREIRRCLDDGVDPGTVGAKKLIYDEFFVQRYVPMAESRNKKSVATDQSRHANHIKPVFGSVLLDEITPDAVCCFYLQMQEKGLSLTTVKHVMDQFKGCLNLAVKLGLIDRNPASFLDRLPRAPQKRNFPTVDVLARFRASARADSAVVPARMLELAELTCARIGEVMELRWADLDLPNRLWCLSAQKSKKPDGEIHLSCDAVALIEEMQYRVNDFVFPSEDGSGHRSRPVRAFARICKRAGLVDGDGKPTFTPHGLRHGWCSAALHAQVPIETVSHGARHSSVAVTRIYSHPYQEDLRAANEKVAALTRG
ncbi:MAG TPA: tyrosine-type recombinase/integrase [Rhodocyclaceae bacterium]|nr:tyrosine-type recombinase/integrase [Rhodocyclaceae bacterium]